MRKPFMVEFTGTPEAGKTTSIGNVANNLKSMGYKVAILKESAEKLPKEIPKGSWDANLWMHYQTQAGLLRAKFMQVDIILIDRGLIDSKFYGKKFLWEGVCTQEDYEKFKNQFMEDLYPDFLVALMVPPEVAVERRGGAGRLVNEAYIERYNEMFERYYEEVQCPKELINTSKFDVYGMNKKILTVILEHLP